jgi:hypothetical protein
MDGVAWLTGSAPMTTGSWGPPAPAPAAALTLWLPSHSHVQLCPSTATHRDTTQSSLPRRATAPLVSPPTWATKKSFDHEAPDVGSLANPGEVSAEK